MVTSGYLVKALHGNWLPVLRPTPPPPAPHGRSMVVLAQPLSSLSILLGASKSSRVLDRAQTGSSTNSPTCPHPRANRTRSRKPQKVPKRVCCAIAVLCSCSRPHCPFLARGITFSPPSHASSSYRTTILTSQTNMFCNVNLRTPLNSPTKGFCRARSFLLFPQGNPPSCAA